MLLLLGLITPLRAGPLTIRLGFSAQTLGEVNETDARAALKVWSQTLGVERGIAVETAPEILIGVEAIKTALLTGTVDAVSMTALEFWSVHKTVHTGAIVLGRIHAEFTEEYLLLVRRDSPAKSLADLRGQSVTLLDSVRTCLAPAWTETLLLEQHLGRADRFWGRITHATKLTRVVLPVFFRQADACVVTREGFRLMSELNPQVGKQLRVLAQSEKLTPGVFCLRGDLTPRQRDKFLAQVATIGDTPAGRQILDLFQAGELMQRPDSDMDSACALLDRHQRLLAEAGQAPGSATPAPAAEEGHP